MPPLTWMPEAATRIVSGVSLATLATRGSGAYYIFGHVDDDGVPDDPGVVYEDVQITEVVDVRLDEALRPLPSRDAVSIRDGLAAHSRDLVATTSFAEPLGRSQYRRGYPEVVDDDLAPSLAKSGKGINHEQRAAPLMTVTRPPRGAHPIPTP